MGFIDKDGKMVITLEPGSRAEDFSDGLALVWVGGKGAGYIDKSGKMVIPPQFAKASMFSQGLAPASVGNNGPFGYIDKTGKFVIQGLGGAYPFFSAGVAMILSDQGKSCYVDKTGKHIWEPPTK
jgi:hypothetical protein